MAFKPRLLPVVMLAAGLMLVVRLNGLWHEAGAALAQAMPPVRVPPASRQLAEAPPAATPPAATPAAAAQPPAASDPFKPGQPPKFSQEEVNLLQDLAKRRDQLDQREEDVARHEVQLKALEQEINGKIDKLTSIKGQIEDLIGKVDAQEDERLKSLVKIYETMKPTDAAKILGQLDMPVLLQVMTRMKDAKVAPVLAAFDPGKARAVTEALAEKRQLPDIKNN